LLRRQFSEQYLTDSQFFAHFLRHSNGSLQRSQIFGSKPFFVLALMDHSSIQQTSPKPDHIGVSMGCNPAITKSSKWTRESDKGTQNFVSSQAKKLGDCISAKELFGAD